MSCELAATHFLIILLFISFIYLPDILIANQNIGYYSVGISNS